MKKNTRLLSLLLAFTLILGVAITAPVTASALGDGEGIDDTILSDPDYESSVSLVQVNEKGKSVKVYDILKHLEVGEKPEGVSFDLESFTLSLDNVDMPDCKLVIHRNPRKEVRISVSGTNRLAAISMTSSIQYPLLFICGTGTLTVNENKQFDYAITMRQRIKIQPQAAYPSLTFDDEVGLKLYGKKAAASIYSLNTMSESPVITDTGYVIDTAHEQDLDEAFVSVNGVISNEYVPGSEYTKKIGAAIGNDNDPDGDYAEDDLGLVYKCYHDDTYDVIVYDWSVEPAQHDESIHHFKKDAKDNKVFVTTKDYEEREYVKIRALDNNEYLVDQVDYENAEAGLNPWPCNGFSFEMLDENVRSSSGNPYAVVGEAAPIRIYGAMSETPSQNLGSVTGITINDSLGYLANYKNDDGYTYTYTLNFGSGGQNGYQIHRYLYNEQLDAYFRDTESEPYYDEFTEEEFLAEYTPVMQENNRVKLKSEKQYQTMYFLRVYQDDENKQYACELYYNEETNQPEIETIYTMTELDRAIDNSVRYLFVPADGVDPATLTEVKNQIPGKGYNYTIASTDYTYNMPEDRVTVQTLDVENVWTHPFISNNPGCKPCYVPFTASISNQTGGGFVFEERWTSAAGDCASSKLDPAALKPGYEYTYSVLIKAKPGYVFDNDMTVTFFKKAVPGATVIVSNNKRSAMVYGLTKVTFMLDTPVLDSVANVYDGVQFKWKSVKGGSKYRVFRKDAKTSWKKLGDTTALSFTDKTAVSGTKYTYTVRAISNDAKVLTSGFDSVGKTITYVAAPRITKFENVNSGTRITWRASKGAAYYRVMYKKSNTWTKLADVKGTAYTATRMASGTKRCYTVRAMNAGKKFVSAYYAPGWSATFIAAPALPKLANTKRGVKVTFTKPKGSLFVRVMRKTAKGKWIRVRDTSGTTIIDSTAKKGVRYYYTVRCLANNQNSFVSGYNTKGRSIVCKR